MTISVIVPVFNGMQTLSHCLNALAASSRPGDELIVVDDGSTDGSGACAERMGATLLQTDHGPLGPAAARNLAAAAATGDVLLFIDADVVVHSDTVEGIGARFQADPALGAVFGSYDDSPPAPGLISRYKNLLHHHVHQNAAGVASTFWAGCGAVRTQAFRAVGGFDDVAFPLSSIEDIDLGVRLNKAGYEIQCRPDIQATHWKRWKLVGWLRTDILMRAIPWTRLILREGALPNSLNLDNRARLSALGSLTAVGLGIIAPWFPVGLIFAVLALAIVAVCNLGLLRLLFRRGGVGLLVGGFCCHVVYYLYSSLVFATLTATHQARRLVLGLPAVAPHSKFAKQS